MFGQFWGVVVMEALHLYPIMLLNVDGGAGEHRPGDGGGGANLGASRGDGFSPHHAAADHAGRCFAGGTIVLIWSFTELGTPLMFDFYTVTPVQVFRRITEMADNPLPYALVVVMLVAAVLLYLIGQGAAGAAGYAMASARPTVAGDDAAAAGWWGWLGGRWRSSWSSGLAVLPHLAVVLTSFAEHRRVVSQRAAAAAGRWRITARALSHELAMPSIQNSLLYCAGWRRCWRWWWGWRSRYLIVRSEGAGRGLLDALAMLPLAVPGLVLAFGYLAMSWRGRSNRCATVKARWRCRRLSFVSVQGRNPNPIPLLLVIAYAIRRLPYVVRSAAAGLEQTSGELEEAALNLGRVAAARRSPRITVPLIMANLIAGGLLVFASPCWRCATR